MADTLGDQIYKDILAYTNDVVRKADKAAKEIQRQMVPMATNASPVRQYSTHTQEVSNITVHRSPPAVRRAVHRKAPEKFQPGYFRSGWTVGTIAIANGKLYGVRNKHMPTVTHLINFDHDLVVHGIRNGVVHGSGFVDAVQEWAERELDKRLSEFLEKE